MNTNTVFSKILKNQKKVNNANEIDFDFLDSAFNKFLEIFNEEKNVIEKLKTEFDKMDSDDFCDYINLVYDHLIDFLCEKFNAKEEEFNYESLWCCSFIVYEGNNIQIHNIIKEF